MSFRQYGGINYAARNNIVKNNYTNANNLSVMTRVGQNSSVIYVDSGLVMSANLTFKYMNAPFYGIIFSDGTVQTTAITTTDSYWQPYDSTSTPVIYYTNRVLIGADPTITEGSIDSSIKLAVNGGIAANGNLYAGYVDPSGNFSNKFFVEGSSGNTTVGGTLGVTGVTTFNNDIIQSNSEVNNITQQNLATNTNENNLRKTYIYGDLQLRRPTSAQGGALWLYDVASGTSGYFSQFYTSGTGMNYINKNNTGRHIFTCQNGSGVSANPFYFDYSNMSIVTQNPPTCSAVQPASTDSSNKIPTTAWVQSAIGGAAYWTPSGNNIYSSNSGNVGIGTNSPAYKLDINGTLGVTGSSSLNSLIVTNNASVSGTLGVTGSSTLASLSVTGNAGVGGTLGVTGSSTLNSLSVTNNASVGGTLGVTGLSTLASLSVTNNASVGGTLNVNGYTTTVKSRLLGYASGVDPFWIGLSGSGSDGDRTAIALEGDSSTTGLVTNIKMSKKTTFAQLSYGVTPAAGDNSTTIATTAFVQNAISGGLVTSSQIYGDGSDGDLTFNGSSITGFTYSNNVYTMTQEIYARNITMSGGYTIKPNGFRLFCSGTFTSSNSANYITCSGSNGGAGTSLGAGGIGGAGGSYGGANGGAGGSYTNSTVSVAGSNTTSSFSTNYGSGGSGATNLYPSKVGGVTVVLSTLPKNFWKSYLNIYTMFDVNGVYYTGGAGGGGGGGGGSSNNNYSGGGGGGGGGAMAIFVNKFALNSYLYVTANGGNGGDGPWGGGGGGGGGGFVMLCTSSSSNSLLSITANGGNKGVTPSNYAQPSNGTNGIVSVYYNLS